MPHIADFNDRRYLDEIGWFLSYEKYTYENTCRSYAEDRMDWSEMFLRDLLTACNRTIDWIRDKAIVSIGAGCSGDVAAWPAGSKIAVDPLAFTYQHLDMLIADRPGTAPTTYLSVGIESLPLLDDCADIILCRNALDHMHDPAAGLREIRRILKAEGIFFLWVDIGGLPTPDEPSPFTMDSLLRVLDREFVVLSLDDRYKSHSADRDFSVRVLARGKDVHREKLDKKRLLDAYEAAVAKPSGAS